MTTITATEMQNNFGKYLQAVQSGEEIIILKNGKEVARIISRGQSVSFLSDSLVGILHGDYDSDSVKQIRTAKYESDD